MRSSSIITTNNKHQHHNNNNNNISLQLLQSKQLSHLSFTSRFKLIRHQHNPQLYQYLLMRDTQTKRTVIAKNYIYQNQQQLHNIIQDYQQLSRVYYQYSPAIASHNNYHQKQQLQLQCYQPTNGFCQFIGYCIQNQQNTIYLIYDYHHNTLADTITSMKIHNININKNNHNINNISNNITQRQQQQFTQKDINQFINMMISALSKLQEYGNNYMCWCFEYILVQNLGNIDMKYKLLFTPFLTDAVEQIQMQKPDVESYMLSELQLESIANKNNNMNNINIKESNNINDSIQPLFKNKHNSNNNNNSNNSNTYNSNNNNTYNNNAQKLQTFSQKLISDKQSLGLMALKMCTIDNQTDRFYQMNQNYQLIWNSQGLKNRFIELQRKYSKQLCNKIQYLILEDQGFYSFKQMPIFSNIVNNNMGNSAYKNNISRSRISSSSGNKNNKYSNKNSNNSNNKNSNNNKYSSNNKNSNNNKYSSNNKNSSNNKYSNNKYYQKQQQFSSIKRSRNREQLQISNFNNFSFQSQENNNHHHHQYANSNNTNTQQHKYTNSNGSNHSNNHSSSNHNSNNHSSINNIIKQQKHKNKQIINDITSQSPSITKKQTYQKQLKYIQGLFHDNIQIPKNQLHRLQDPKIGETYIGQIKNNLKNGIGINYNRQGNVYYGEWNQDQMTGQGIYLFQNGDIYSGKIYKGLKHGYGKYKHWNGNIYIGQWQNDIKNGHGTYKYHTKGDQYQGEFKDNMRNGTGLYKQKNGAKYHGKFYKGLKNGNGTAWLKNGTKIEGTWNNDVLESILTKVQYPNGNKYIGGVTKQQQLYGIGQYTTLQGNYSSKGTFKQNKLTSSFIATTTFNNKNNNSSQQCQISFQNGDRYSGTILNNKPDGIGKYYYKQQNSQYIGQWKQGKQNGIGIMKYQNGTQIQCKWNNGQYQKIGKIRYQNGDQYCGQISNMGRNGRGVYVNYQGDTIKGIFCNGILVTIQ